MPLSGWALAIRATASSGLRPARRAASTCRRANSITWRETFTVRLSAMVTVSLDDLDVSFRNISVRVCPDPVDRYGRGQRGDQVVVLRL